MYVDLDISVDLVTILSTNIYIICYYRNDKWDRGLTRDSNSIQSSREYLNLRKNGEANNIKSPWRASYDQITLWQKIASAHRA